MQDQVAFSTVYAGKEIRVVKSANASYSNVSGYVEDETKNMFRISTETGKIMVPKRGNIFSIRIDGEDVKVNGSDICYKVSDRIKQSSRIARAAARRRER